MSKKILQLSLVLLVVFFVSACTLPWKKDQAVKTEKTNDNIQNSPPVVAKPEKAKSGELKQFANSAELKKFLQTNIIMAGSSMAASKLVDNSAQNSPANYFASTRQMWGADKPDIIKAVNGYIYALVRDSLLIIKADPKTDLKVVSKITFNSRPADLFVRDNSLVVFGYENKTNRSNFSTGPLTFLKVFNINDPSAPKLVRDLSFTGKYITTRLVGDYVYLIISNKVDYLNGGPLLPEILVAGKKLELSFPVSYFDIDYKSYNYTSVIAINIKNNKLAIKGQVYLLDGSQAIYLSSDNIYLSYSKSLNKSDLSMTVRRKLLSSKLNSADQEKITKINSAPAYILSPAEKKVKINQIISDYLSSLTTEKQKSWQKSIATALNNELISQAKTTGGTTIYKINIKDGNIKYKTRGEVAGRLLDQFSINENGDYLRLVTARSKIWSQLTKSPNDSYSNIYVLDAALNVVGKLENLATSNKISSAHFIGNRVYLMSLEKTDPVYVVSLAQPTAPSILGAIKVPGASPYLQAIDANGTKLVGLAYYHKTSSDSGADNGQQLKLSLFDFSDLSKPKEVSSYLIGGPGSSSISLFDHRSFFYSASKKLISVPATLKENNGRLAFAGVIILNLENSQFKLKGRVDHSEGGHFMTADTGQGIPYYDNTVRRSFYVGNDLYTFSNKFLKINKISDLSLIKALKLIPDSADDFVTTPLLEPKLETGSSVTATSTPTSTLETSATSTATTSDSKLDQTATSTSTTTAKTLP